GRGVRSLPSPYPFLDRGVTFVTPRLLACVVALACVAAGPLDGLDETISQTLPKANVPGLAVAVVKDDAVVYARGFGVRELGGKEPVDPDTVFAVGSVTKGMTAAALAMLAEDGKLTWDSRAAELIPGLEFADPYATREMTVRDLLTHRSGLPAYGGDLLFSAYDYPRLEILRRARFLKPDNGFRSTFAYQNVLYTAAGEIVTGVSGRSWDDFLNNRIFLPLGMDRTGTRSAELGRMSNVATPHALIEGTLQAVPRRNIDSAGGAGAAYSTASDLTRWLRVQLGLGRFGDRTLWSRRSAREMHRPQTVMRPQGLRARLYPEANFLTYGLGWAVWDYRGRKVVEHGGSVDGMTAAVGMIPDRKLGVVVLANADFSLLPHGVMLHVFDRYLGPGDGETADRIAEMLELEQEFRREQREKEEKALAERVPGTKPSLAAEAYAGRYESPLYGEADVTRSGGKLVLNVGTRLTGDLEHFHFDTFLVRWRNPIDGRGLVRFALSDLGKVTGLRLTELARPDQGDMVFAKRADKREEEDE
ncbi:MAG TPA: serine hydrolase, partial [Gemmataceae bacterium]